MAAGFHVTQRQGVVEVEGATASEVSDAMTVYGKLRELQGFHVAATKSDLVNAFMRTEVSLTPPASVRIAQRLASRRDALLTTPTFSSATLAQLRGQQDSSARTWFYRQQKKGRLFSVIHHGEVVIPAFQLTDIGDVRPELAAMIEPLRQAGVDGWAIWNWLTSPTSWLSGQTPEAVAGKEPDRAATAARRFAARPAA